MAHLLWNFSFSPEKEKKFVLSWNINSIQKMVNKSTAFLVKNIDMMTWTYILPEGAELRIPGAGLCRVKIWKYSLILKNHIFVIWRPPSKLSFRQPCIQLHPSTRVVHSTSIVSMYYEVIPYWLWPFPWSRPLGLRCIWMSVLTVLLLSSNLCHRLLSK